MRDDEHDQPQGAEAGIQPMLELVSEVGPVAVMSLERRMLLEPLQTGALRVGAPDPDRRAAALVGIAVGRSLADRAARLRRDAAVTAELLLRAALTPTTGRSGAEARTAIWSAEAFAGRAWAAPVAFAERLARSANDLADPGRTLPTVAAELRQGVDWFEAGAPSFGNAALPRAIAAGVAFAFDPAAAALAAQADAAVTHAHPIATSCAAAVGALTSGLVARESGVGEQLDAVLDALTAGDGHTARVVRRCRADAGRFEHLTARELSAALGGEPAAPATLTTAIWALHRREQPARVVADLAMTAGRTTTAVVAGLLGAAHGIGAFPAHWTEHVDVGDELRRAASRFAGDESPTRHVGDHRDPGRRADDAPTTSSIWFLLDRSGSMASIAADVVGGFDRFFAEQAAEPGATRVTLVQFDSEHPHEVIVDDAPITSVPSIAGRFSPRGLTPLYDAVGLLLDRAERARGAPADQLVVILTDGQENHSRTWDRERLFERIAGLQARGWTFVFLGANQDSYAEGGSLGVQAGNVSNFAADPAGVSAAYAGLSRATRDWRAKPAAARRQDAGEFWGGTKEAEDDLQRRARRHGRR